MRLRHSLDRRLTPKAANGGQDLTGSMTAQLAEEIRGERWDARRPPRSHNYGHHSRTVAFGSTQHDGRVQYD